MNRTYPYNDDYMVFDEETNQYRITEAELERNGVYLRAKLQLYPTINASNVIYGLTQTASNHVYAYLQQFSTDNFTQYCLIAKTPSARYVIKAAMLEQFKYIFSVGNLAISPKKEERENYMAPMAVAKLNTVIPEWGHSMTYTGGW